MAALSHPAWAGRLSCRRHGAGQNHSGAGDAGEPLPSGAGRRKKAPSLLVAPASLLANWAQESERFTPDLKILVAHPAFLSADELRAMDEKRLASVDLVVTSYATLLRLDWIAETNLASCDARRSAGDQESQRQTDHGRQIPEGRGAHRADRHADREQSARPLVDFRFSQSGPARLLQGLRQFRQVARRAAACLLCAAAQAGAALHPAPAEDRQEHHR